MQKSQIIKDIVFLPQKFYEGNASPHSLLKESGYFEYHDQISERDISEVLTQHLECIDQWVFFIADKRCACWYFTQNGGKYIVGYYSIQRGHERVTEYSDRVEACAAYIKQEIEEIRQIPIRSRKK